VEVVASLSQGRTAAAQCSLFTHKSVPVIFEPPCIIYIDNNAKQTECPETSARNYHSTLRNGPEERRSHLPHGKNPKSRVPLIIFHNNTTVFSVNNEVWLSTTGMVFCIDMVIAVRRTR